MYLKWCLLNWSSFYFFVGGEEIVAILLSRAAYSRNKNWLSRNEKWLEEQKFILAEDNAFIEELKWRQTAALLSR